MLGDSCNYLNLIGVDVEDHLSKNLRRNISDEQDVGLRHTILATGRWII